MCVFEESHCKLRLQLHAAKFVSCETLELILTSQLSNFAL